MPLVERFRRMPGVSWPSYLPVVLLGIASMTLALLLVQSFRAAVGDNGMREAHLARGAALEEIERHYLQTYLDRTLYALTEDPAHLEDARGARAAAHSALAALASPEMRPAENPALGALAAAGERLAALSIDAAPAETRRFALGDDPFPVATAFSGALEGAILAERRVGEALALRATEGGRDFMLLVVAMGATILMLLVTLSIASRRAASAEAERARAQAMRAERDRAATQSAELRHRIGNLFAIVGSILGQTGRQEADPRAALSKARERIGALDRAQRLSLEGETPGDASLDRLIHAVVSPFAPADDRLTIDPTPARLPEALVTSFALIFNELATNATKYGAWSGEAGEAGEVRIRIETGRDRVTVAWIERGGPPVSAPGRKGLGSRLIAGLTAQHGLAATQDWSPGGLVATFRIPAEALIQDGSRPA